MRGMDEVALAKRVGRLLRIEREKRSLTQLGLARRVGTSQQCVSRVETGRFAASTDLLERLFDAIDVQLAVAAQARDDDLDRSIAAAVGGTARGLLVGEALRYLERFLRPLGEVPYLVDGALAAMAQGVPMATERIDLAFAASDIDAVTAWVREQVNWKRWEERWQDFGSADADLTRGVLRWATPSFCEVRITLEESLPAGLRVAVGEEIVPVRALNDVEAADPQIARLAARAHSWGKGWCRIAAVCRIETMDYEYAPLRLPPNVDRPTAEAQLAIQAEFSGWELARVRLYRDGTRQVVLRRRLVNMPQPGLSY
jgi:transcriptional regulator with XRE-family HTH domain